MADVLLQIRNDTAANWTSNNPTILPGEMAVENNTGKVKWNRSSSGVAYNSLAYFTTTSNSTPIDPLDSDLATIAGLTPTTDNILQAVGSVWASRTPAQVRAVLVPTYQLTSTASVSNTTTETTLWTPSNFPAGNLVANTTLFRVRLGGTFDNIATSGTFTLRLKINGTTPAALTWTITSQSGAATVTPWFIEDDIFIDTTGASGQVTLTGTQPFFAAGGAKTPVYTAATVGSINLTAGFQLTATGQWATANAGNVFRIFRASLQQIS